MSRDKNESIVCMYCIACKMMMFGRSLLLEDLEMAFEVGMAKKKKVVGKKGDRESHLWPKALQTCFFVWMDIFDSSTHRLCY